MHLRFTFCILTNVIKIFYPLKMKRRKFYLLQKIRSGNRYSVGLRLEKRNISLPNPN